jgi:hypothetical protein
VATDVLGGAVHDSGRAQLEWPAEDGRGKGVVNDHRHVRFPAQPGDRLQVADAAEGIADRLAEQERGSPQSRLHCRQVPKVDLADLVAEAGQVPVQQGERGSVGVHPDHDRGRPGRAGQNRVEDGGHPGGGRHRRLGALEGGYRRLQLGHVVVRIAAVLMTL